MTVPAYPSASRGGGNYLPPVPVQRRWRDAVRIWWREIDKLLLALILLLMTVGIVAVAAASPASADQLSTSKARVADFMFFQRHIVFQLMGLSLMIGLSFLNRDQARRLGILVGAVMLALLFVVPLIGEEKNGHLRSPSLRCGAWQPAPGSNPPWRRPGACPAPPRAAPSGAA